MRSETTRSIRPKRPGARPRGAAPRRSLLLAALGIGRLRPIDQLDEGHRRVVADAETHLQNPRVAARARLVARPQLVEELGDDVAVARAVEGEPAVRQR